MEHPEASYRLMTSGGAVTAPATIAKNLSSWAQASGTGFVFYHEPFSSKGH